MFAICRIETQLQIGISKNKDCRIRVARGKKKKNRRRMSISVNEALGTERNSKCPPQNLWLSLFAAD